MSNKKLQLGTVSKGTMIAENVYDAILSYLKVYRPKLWQKFLNNHVAPTRDYDIEYLVWEVTFDLMNSIAPTGYYFGAHPSNGCDYGFWKSEEM